MTKGFLGILAILFAAFISINAETSDSLDVNSITIVAKKNVANTPVFLTKELDTAILGHLYECKVKARAKDPNFEMEASGLPYGMELTKKGKIKGKAYLDGKYKVYIKAKTKYHEKMKAYDLVVDVEKKHRKYYYLSKGIDAYPNLF